MQVQSVTGPTYCQQIKSTLQPLMDRVHSLYQKIKRFILATIEAIKATPSMVKTWVFFQGVDIFVPGPLKALVNTCHHKIYQIVNHLKLLWYKEDIAMLKEERVMWESRYKEALREIQGLNSSVHNLLRIGHLDQNIQSDLNQENGILRDQIDLYSGRNGLVSARADSVQQEADSLRREIALFKEQLNLLLNGSRPNLTAEDAQILQQLCPNDRGFSEFFQGVLS